MECSVAITFILNAYFTFLCRPTREMKARKNENTKPSRLTRVAVWLAVHTRSQLGWAPTQGPVTHTRAGLPHKGRSPTQGQEALLMHSANQGIQSHCLLGQCDGAACHSLEIAATDSSDITTAAKVIEDSCS